MEIDVPAICGEDIISRQSGSKIRTVILENWAEPELLICLRGKRVASVSFFDEAIGLLMKKGGKTVEEMRAKLKFPDLLPFDRKLLNRVVTTRLEEQSE